MTNSSFPLLRPLANDELVGGFAMARFLAHRDLAPLGLGLAADRRLALAPPLGMAARGEAAGGPQPHLTRRQPNLGPAAFFGHQLGAHARATDHLSAATGLGLDVVDDRADRDVAQGQRIARRQVSLGAAAQTCADADADRRQDVAPLAVFVLEQRNARAAIGVVFDGNDLADHAQLVALPI